MVAARSTEVLRRPATPADRVAAAFLVVVLAAGSLVLWVGIPVAGLWLLSQMTDSGTRHFLLSLVFIPPAMALFAALLFWINGLYLRVVGALGPDDDAESRWRVRGPLEVFLRFGMVIALAALLVWIFVLSESPPYTVW